MSEKKHKVRVDLNSSVDDNFTTATRHATVKPTRLFQSSTMKKYLPTFTALPSEPKSYTPILYTFRVKIKNPSPRVFSNIPAKTPPYHILLDHTIAVLWTLFSPKSDKAGLGVNQLQWAHHFLKSITNTDGVQPKDVQLATDAVEDYLIATYAEMSEESAVYATSKFEGPKGDTDRTDEEEPTFSSNYSQMIDRYPGAPTVVETESEVFDRELLQELEHVKVIVGIESVDLSRVASKQQVMEILSSMQKEQIEKITNEMKTLYVVEDMMKNTDEPHFRGYTDEKQFETIFKRSDN